MALHFQSASSEPFQESGQVGRVDKEVDLNHLKEQQCFEESQRESKMVALVKILDK
jgi:hypothetical protein